MSRWLVLAVFSAAPVFMGCGSSMHMAQASRVAKVGLANAPALGGPTVADAHISDAISNGEDACSVSAEQGRVPGNRFPPCPTFTPMRTASRQTAPASAGQANRGLVQPWLNHFYVGWPCPDEVYHARAWSAWGPPPADATLAECAVPTR